MFIVCLLHPGSALGGAGLKLYSNLGITVQIQIITIVIMMISAYYYIFPLIEKYNFLVNKGCMSLTRLTPEKQNSLHITIYV